MLLAGGTGLCALSDPGFQAWLGAIYRVRVARVAGSSESALVTRVPVANPWPRPDDLWKASTTVTLKTG